MSNEANVTVVPKIDAPKSNPKARYTAYMQCVRKMEMRAKAEKKATEEKGGNQ